MKCIHNSEDDYQSKLNGISSSGYHNEDEGQTMKVRIFRYQSDHKEIDI